MQSPKVDLIEDLRKSLGSFLDHHQGSSLDLADVSAERDVLVAERDAFFMALSHVFPFDLYREKRQDLVSFNQEDLVRHFAFNGIHEGVDLRPASIENELQQLRDRVDDDAARSDLIKINTQRTAEQLELLKDLLVRLMSKI